MEGEEEEDPLRPKCRNPGDSVNAAAAVQAFKRCRGDLLGISEPLRLANELYSRDIVTMDICDQVLLNITPMEKNMRLLNAIEARLKTHPSDFTTVVTILEADSVLKGLGNRLKDCYREVCASGSVVVTSPQTPPDPMNLFVSSLKAVYKNTAVPPCNKEYPTPSTVYTTLAVVKKEPVRRAVADKFTKATLHGGIDEIMNTKEQISIEGVFKPENEKKEVSCVLVEGAPGVGKSTFALEICRRWDSVAAMKKFAVVVLLRLQEKRVQQATSVVDLFYHDLPHVQQSVVEKLMSTGGDNVLLVLDGFDEFPAKLRKDSLIARVIQGQCPSIAKATVLVTSQPSARVDLLKLRPVPDKHIEVLGFTSDLVDLYTSNVFHSDPQLLADFRKYLDANPVIKGMMYIPLHSAIVVEIYRENSAEGKPIPQTMTQLYTQITLTRLRSHLIDQGVVLPASLEDLPEDICSQLLCLAKLAYEGNLKQEVIFEKLPDGCSPLGLMVASQELYLSNRGSFSYNFFHFTLQEFLSAFYISKLPDSDQWRLFQEHSSHWNTVWKFVAGLTGFQAIGWDIPMGAPSRGKVGIEPSFLHCLYEAQEKVDCESVLSDFGVLCLNTSTSLFDYFALGYCIAASGCTWDLDLSSKFHDPFPEVLQLLDCGLKYGRETQWSIRELILSGSLKGKEDVARFGEMPQRVFQQLSVLEASNCELDRLALDLLSGIVSTMANLKSLVINHNPGGHGGFVKLFKALRTASQLHTLCMAGVTLGCEDVAALSDWLRPPGSLKFLTIGEEKYTSPECVELMMKALLSQSSLERVFVVDVTLPTWVSLSLLQTNHNLKEISFDGCVFPSQSICNLAEVLCKNTSLQKFSMYVTVVTVPAFDQGQLDATATSMANMLEVNRTLSHVRFDVHMLTKNTDGSTRDITLSELGVQALVDVLRHNYTVRQLRLGILSQYSVVDDKTIDSRVLFSKY